MAVDKSLISGSTTMLILRLLEEKDMYGYEMIGQKTRKYYSLTKNGKNFLSQKKEEWKEYSSAVANILTADRNTIFPVLKPQMEG